MTSRRRNYVRDMLHSFARNVDEVITVDEMRHRARMRLPRVVYDSLVGGAGDELTIRANRAAFERVSLRPRALADVSQRDLSTTVLGDRVSMPILLDPCGFARMCDSEADVAVARAAGRAETVFAISSASSSTPDEIMRAASGPLWYQLFPDPNPKQLEIRLRHATDLGYRVLCVTVDCAVAPARDRDYYNRLTVPLQLSPRLIVAGLSRPAWSKDFLLGEMGRGIAKTMWAYRNLASTIASLEPVTFDDLRWLREHWDGPLVVKGVMRHEEVPAMIDIGVDGILVSNHGGRNLDTGRGALDILPEVVQAANGRVEVFVDGGVRRGVDVIKAIALGARAVLIGRPYMYGLAAGGEQGVYRVLEILRLDLERAMALAGCAAVADIDRSIAHIDDVDRGPELSP
jgi:isopentenyl diphosphate isomerase/L-lactate dehydrogenase-like FMN-dependent dehydrogenase